METELRLAVLIDAENISDKYIKIIMDETAGCGIATYKRIYGDWTGKRLSSWKPTLLDNSIIPMQQYSYTKGKNATDSAMIIDAMDILYSGTVDGFCLVSSDSDFTRLAARLRESGMMVIGMGESKTPQPFISACNQFKYLDLLLQKSLEEEAPAEEPETVEETKSTSSPRKMLKTVRKTIRSIQEQFSDDEGWLFSGKLGDQLSKRLPDFDVRNFGFYKLTPFLKSLGDLEAKEIADANNQKQIYFRVMEKKKPTRRKNVKERGNEA